MRNWLIYLDYFSTYKAGIYHLVLTLLPMPLCNKMRMPLLEVTVELKEFHLLHFNYDLCFIFS